MVCNNADSLNFRLVFESVPGLYLVLAPDPGFTIIAASNAYLRATMTRREEIIGRRLFDVYPDEPASKNAQTVRNLRASLMKVMRERSADVMNVQRYDLPQPRHGGPCEERYWSPVNSPVLEDGKLVYIIHRVEDVTEFVRHERFGIEQRALPLNALTGAVAAPQLAPFLKTAISGQGVGVDRAAPARANAEKHPEAFVALAKSSCEFIGMCDLNAMPFFINDAGLKLVGLETLEAGLQTPVHEFFYPEDQAYIMNEFFPGVLREGRGEVEIRFRHFQTGKPIWMIYSVFALNDSTGRPIGLATVSKNITERKRAEAELRRAKAAAEAANSAKDDFLAVLSHELRTPVGAALIWAKLLQSGVLDPEKQKNAIERILRCNTDQMRLIDELLDASRMLYGKQFVDLASVDLAHLASSAVEAIRPQAETAGIELRLKCDDAVILGDEIRLKQLVNNLLSNAMKFTAPGGCIQVEIAHPSPDKVELRVSDTGEGISHALLPHLFERFRQADTSLTRRHGGLGLGLFIVRSIAESHGGSVRAESPGLGQGATFSVTLPRHGHEPSAHNSAHSPHGTPLIATSNRK